MSTTDVAKTDQVTDLVSQYAYGMDTPSSNLDAVWAEINRLGLSEYVAELEAQGFTVIPPEKVAPKDFTERLRQKVLEVAERRTGQRPLVEEADTQGDTPFGQMLQYMLFEDPIFQEAVLNPTALAMASYLVGRSAMVYTFQSFLKGPGGNDLPLHTDNIMMPAPYAPYAQICNTTLLLSDYSRERGSICFVPGSHRFGRPPEPGEMLDQRVPIDAPAGSLVVWPGSTWHGAFRRQTAGLRMTLVMMYSRMYVIPQEPYRENVTQEILDRNPARFATLMGQHHAYGYEEEGIDFVKVAAFPGKSWWD